MTDHEFTPNQERQLLDAQDLFELKLVQTPAGWYFCTLSEGRLESALADGKVIMVNGVLMVKFVGVIAGLCLQDVRGPRGEIIMQKGTWYSPVEQTRDRLKQIAVDGSATNHLQLADSVWTHMRLAVIPAQFSTVEEYIISLRTQFDAGPHTLVRSSADIEPQPFDDSTRLLETTILAKLARLTQGQGENTRSRQDPRAQLDRISTREELNLHNLQQLRIHDFISPIDANRIDNNRLIEFINTLNHPHENNINLLITLPLINQINPNDTSPLRNIKFYNENLQR